MNRTLLCTFSCTMMLLTPAAFAQKADYSECAFWFNNLPVKEDNPRGYRIKKSGPYVPTRLRYIPFDLKDDGSLSVHSDARLSHSGRHEVITYESPDIVFLESLEEDSAPRTSRAVQTIVERNSQGHITAIVENRGLVADEDAEIKRIEQWSGNPDLAFSYKETRTTFAIVQGVCVPMSSNEIVVRKQNAQRQLLKIPVFDTKFCQAIRHFGRENRTIWGSFNRTMNSRMNDLFREHEYVMGDQEDRFLSYKKITELANKHVGSDTWYLRDLSTQILVGYMVGNQVDELKAESYGMSPVVAAIMILADCNYQRLGNFIYSDLNLAEVD